MVIECEIKKHDDEKNRIDITIDVLGAVHVSERQYIINFAHKKYVYRMDM